ncbi:immunoglobulin-binding protein 1-like [Haliotis rufescens]|uniref:immunoglobulin-binding protein 1-like n=1 Tax=Haliotis rufescens TaxID=6454 RepID=UPI001EB020D2|nr:immunoglobulin-binding protein 1-like [Haliotis rufescens]
MAEAPQEGSKLSDLFEEIWKIFIFVDTCDEPLADDKVQDKIYFGVQKCEKAVHMTNELSLFSDNESLDEVASSELKYMLLPALLGFFTYQTTRAERLPLVKKARLFFTDYMRLCKNYEVTDIDVACVDEDGDDAATAMGLVAPRGMDMRMMASTRQSKIEQFRKKKEMEKRMKELHELMEKESVEEEVKREYYTTMLKQWVSRSMEEIDSINTEIPILEHMARMKAEQKKHPNDHKNEHPPKKQAKPFRPFILTKDMVQKQVFGAGYSALPTYTIEEFYEQKLADGTFHPPTSGMGNMSLQDRVADPEAAAAEEEKYWAEEERKVETDQPEELQRKRELDDWKDDHRRGWGNRKNML